MRKPMIAVVPLVDEARESYWMLPGYFRGISEAGGIPVMLPLTADTADLTQLADAFDGFLFTGGHDVSPSCYGMEKLPYCRDCCPDRDAMEGALVPLVLTRDKAVLGICRGLQFLNAALGGTLYQDLPTEHPSLVIHSQQPPYDQPSHDVAVTPASPLFALTGGETAWVNSCHHQGIRDLVRGSRSWPGPETGWWRPCTSPTPGSSGPSSGIRSSPRLWTR